MREKRKILFVDDEPNILEGLRRTFRNMRHEWALAFAHSAQEALDILCHVSFDVVVSDVRMPGMDGVQFLTEVMTKYPNIVRIVLADPSDKKAVLGFMNPSHQVLTKPYDSEKLKAILSRTLDLRDRLFDQRLKTIVSQMETFPSVPSLYTEFMAEAGAENVSTQKLGEIISRDEGMTSKVLKLANSAVFGAGQKVTDPVQAVQHMGLETIQGLVLSIQMFSHLEVSTLGDLSASRLWDHSMNTAVFAREIAREEKADQTMIRNAVVAGMNHDSGKLILAANLTEDYGKIISLAREKSIALCDGELERIGTTHAEVGAYLMGLWGFHDQIVEAVAFHDHPRECLSTKFSPLTLLHVANALEHEAAGDDYVCEIDLDYLKSLGLEERLPLWREKCLRFAEEHEPLTAK